MVKQQTPKGSFKALDENSALWQALKEQPAWWKNILQDEDLYVEVRKDNYVNVYYEGGNVALIKYGENDVEALTHHKYLGEKKKDKLYLNSIELIKTKEGIEAIKNKIKQEYASASKEKEVQAKLKLSNKDLYIDSEFAYKVADRKTMRIDLIALREKTLHFVELKLITDARLRVKEGPPEINEQMGKYRKFITEHAEDFKNYYSKLLKIKKDIGLWSGETEIENVSLIPQLLVVNTYKKQTEAREERIEYIKNLGSDGSFETILVAENKL